MITAFYGFNSRISLIDEVQDEFSKLSRNRGDYLNQIFTTKKMLYNNLDSIEPILTRDRSTPTIHLPKYSFFGVGTGSGLYSATDDEFVSGGLQSRIAVYPMMSLADKTQAKPLAVSSFDTQALKRILTTGANSESFNLCQYEQIKKIQSAGKVLTEPIPDHVPAVSPQVVLEMEHDASIVFTAFMKTQEARYRALVEMDKAGSEVSPASVIDRSVQMAVKFASLHGLGKTWDSRSHKRPKIDVDDAKWGISLASTLADIAAESIDFSSGDRPELLKIKRVLSSNGGCNLTGLICGTKLRSSQIHQEVFELLCRGEVSIKLKNDQPYTFNSDNDPRLFKVPHGSKVFLQGVDS